jgi:glycosyltransferase involved in cell wall biosynthesis
MAMSEAMPLRVLIVHNAYQQWGGEDSVVQSEVALLRQRGHPVETLIRHNDDVTGMSRVQLAREALWSSRTVAELQGLKATFRPDVIHVHNTLPLVSPSVFWGADQADVPVVQTLHNFRLMCPQAMFVRNGQICEDCLGGLPWRGVLRGCYRDSVAQSAVVAATTVLHRAIGTYRHKVDRYIALNAFCRNKFIEGGLPAERIVIKPNFVDVAGVPSWEGRRGGLYLGRMTEEKGIPILMEALRLSGLASDFESVGGGPLDAAVAEALGPRHAGFQPAEAVPGFLARVAYMVVPSVWYEGFPRTIVEAYAAGVPVIASRLGSLAEVVDDGVTGLLFEPGDAQDLARKLSWAQSHPEAVRAMGQAARRVYEERYTPDQGHAQLIHIYESARQHRRAARAAKG